MAKKKYDLITDLYAEAVKEVTASPENWLSFLRSACRNFRLPFDDQILIYAQRPQASAVLPMKVWNEKFGRWVKRDSKGIAVFDKDSPKLRLKYYYDVSDTQEGRFRRLLRPVPLWEVPEEYQPDVRETLANAFGVDETVTGFAETILEAAKIAAEDNLADYLPDLLAGRKGRFFFLSAFLSLWTVSEISDNAISATSLAATPNRLTISGVLKSVIFRKSSASRYRSVSTPHRSMTI